MLAARRRAVHHAALRAYARPGETGKRNIGMYRMQVYDGQTTGMHWQRQKVAAEHYREALRKAAAAGAEEDPTLSAKAARVAMMAESAGGAASFADGADGGCRGGGGQCEGLADGGGRGDRYRSGDDVCRDCACAAGGGGVHDCRISARQAGGDCEVRDGRS